MEDNGSKAKFLRDVQVYLKDLLEVVLHQSEGLAQGLLNTKEGCEFLERRRPEFYLRQVNSTLLASKQCFSEKCSLENLKKCRKLGIEVNVALQVARQA